MSGKTLAAAAAAAGMSERTARQWQGGPLPSTAKAPRTWRTREDPFAEVWESEVVPQLVADTDGRLQVLTLFKALCRRYPGRFQPGQLRTLQRRVREWRVQYGPDREVYFEQVPVPGREAAFDFTDLSDLGVTLRGVAFPHLLFEWVLSYSRWTYVELALSETFEALVSGLQGALRTLGAEQALLLRGERDFVDEAAYLRFVRAVVDEERNAPAAARVAEERPYLRPLPSARVPEYTTFECRVRKWSTIRVGGRVYSVPSRLVGHTVEARQHPSTVEVLYGGRVLCTMPRLRGSADHRIEYRHIIGSLVRKPGAFARYRFREELFPSLTFRAAYDALGRTHGERADVEYVRLLHLAATTSERQVFGVNYFCRSTTIILAGALAVTPEAPGQLDSLQYRQIQIADLLEQLRGRGPGEGLRQRVPPLPVLFLQFQERLHGVVPLLWPRSPVRWPAVPDPGLAGLAPLPVTCLPLRVRQRHTTILHRYVTDRGSGRPSDRDASVATDPPLGCRRHRCTRARWSATAERLPGAALPGSRTWASLPAGPQGLPARSATGSHPKGRSVAEEPRSGLTACG